MKTKLITTISCLLLLGGAAFGRILLPISGGDLSGGDTIQPAPPAPAATTQSINLFTSGSTTQTSTTVSPGGSFSLDTYITFTGFTAVGLSYWLEVSNPLAPFLTVTSETFFQNWDPNQAGTNSTFTTTTGVESGFTREGRDLGSTSNFDSTSGTFTDPKSPGTYQVSTLNFTLSASTPAGTYTIALTDLSPVPSEINDDGFTANDVAQAFYTVTVVPEPATLSLLGLGGLGSLGLTMLRARRKS